MTSTTPSKPEANPPTPVEPLGREPWLQRWKDPIVVVSFLALIATIVVAAFQILKGDITGSETRLSRQIEAVDVRQREDIKNLREDMKDFRAEQKADIADLRAEQKADIAELRAEQKADIAEFRTEQKADIADLRAEQKADIADLRTEQKADIAELRADNRVLNDKMDRMLEILALYGANQGANQAPPLVDDSSLQS